MLTPPSTPWWKGAVIYQIYPRSFLDTNGDGIGDLPGIIAKLDYLAELGVDAIWVSPFYKSPQADYGYDVADYRDVDPIFGTLDDADRLVEEAHKRGLKVVIDQVLSHTSEKHAWFAESRQSKDNDKADYYVWADPKPDGSPPSNWQSVFGGPAWEWDGRRKQYFLHNFLKEQPDLNLHNDDVRHELLGVLDFWLSRGVDGFRLDALNFAMHDPALTDNPPSDLPMEAVTRPFDMQAHTYNQSHEGIPYFLEEIRRVLDAHGPDRFTVAEVVGAEPLAEMLAFTAGESRLHTAYNFDFLYAEELTPQSVRTSLEQWTKTPMENWPAWAFSNHDAPRAVSRWAAPEHREAAARCYLMLLLSLRGNIFLYQGEELGLPTGDVPFEALKDPEAIANWPNTLGRDGARVPMVWEAAKPHGGFTTGEPWLPVAPRQQALAVDSQVDDAASPLTLTKELLRLRRQSGALTHGDMAFLDHDGAVLGFIRRSGEETVLCVFNLSGEKIAAKAPSDTASLLVASFPADTLPAELPPYGAYWARL